MPINLEIQPKTLEQAIKICVSDLTDDEKDFIKAGVGGLHFGAGMAMRNSWGLWHNSPLAQHIKETYGLGHADDMSGLILEGVVAYVKNGFFDMKDLEPVVQRYKDHWANYGIDPLTQKKIA